MTAILVMFDANNTRGRYSDEFWFSIANEEISLILFVEYILYLNADYFLFAAAIFT